MTSASAPRTMTAWLKSGVSWDMALAPWRVGWGWGGVSDGEEQGGADEHDDGGGEVDAERHGLGAAVAQDDEGVAQGSDRDDEHVPAGGVRAGEGEQGRAEDAEGEVAQAFDG